MSAEALAAILEKGDTKACMEFFRDMPEKERQKYAKQARDCLNKTYQSGWSTQTELDLGLESMTYKESKRLTAVSVAFLSTCTLASYQKHRHNLGQLDDEAVFEILTTRKPEWLADWVNRKLEDEFSYDWPLIRRLVREGVCPKPTSEHYIRGMVHGISSWTAKERNL